MFFIEQQLNRLSRIAPSVYITSRGGVTDDNIAEYAITHVINLTSEADMLARACQILNVPIRDNQETNILDVFPQTNQFIDDALSMQGVVLIHCEQGISRSVTVGCAWLMWKEHHDGHTTDWQKQLAIISSIRGGAGPNQGFRTQLATYEEDLNKKLTLRPGSAR